MDSFRVQVLLSVLRALWDNVAPNLRGVAVVTASPTIGLRFIFDAPLSAADREDASLVASLVTADFLDDVVVAETVDYVPAPAPRLLRDREEWVYLRKESA